MVDVTGKKKVAILGGGMGSLTAAYYLTRTEALRAKHDVTVYQLGWRLGGKCASSRSVAPDEGLRIEEHGLHLWFGFYENAFHTIQEIYERKPSLPDDELVVWRDALKPSSYTPLGEDYQGQLGYWPVVWPTNTDVPGTGLELTPQGAMSQLASLLRVAFGQLLTMARSEGLLDGLADAAVVAELSLLLGILEAVRDLADAPLGRIVSHILPIRAFVDVLRAGLERQATARLGDLEFRRLFSIADLGLTTLLGIVDPRWGIVGDDGELDLDKIDHLDYRDWLLRNGGHPWVVNESSYLRALYDLPFAYDDGDIAKPAFAAGTAIRVLLRMVGTYKEACFFEMQAGMGEAVIAPFYEVLKQQGVKFEFFRKVSRLELSPNKKWVQRIHLERQAEPADPTVPYEPLFRVGGISCWPSEPFFDQLRDGAALRQRLAAQKSSLESHWWTESTGTDVLTLGTHYDQVILGIALAAFKKLNAEPGMCDELLDASPRFGDMVRGLGIVPTQSFQLWTQPDLVGLGWTEPREDLPAMNAAPEPYSVWADCSHVLPHEQWGPNPPGGVFYFCGPWKNTLTAKPSTDSAVPALALEEVKANAIDWLKQYTGYMWTQARSPANPAGLDWNVLYDPRGGVGLARMDFQYIRPNADPTECCETSLPGTTQLRLKADESGFENLFLAGAWLRTGINATCVEAAVMGGMDAARAVSGEPLEIVGEWFCMKKPRR